MAALCGVATVTTSSAIAREPVGEITGYVTDGTRGQPAGAGVDVVLRVMLDGQLVGGAQTVTDNHGLFRFEELPVGHGGYYLPGANLGDVHFPGPRVRLSDTEPNANVELTVYDCVTDVNPLEVDSHRVDIDVQPGRFVVREVLQIRNASRTCYVGQPLRNPSMPQTDSTSRPVTFVLGIPKNFERVTFDEEAFGRRFQLIGDQLVTDIPWPPGERELAFTYAVPITDSHAQWIRPLRLPTRAFDLRVRGEGAENVICSLEPAEVMGDESVRYVAPLEGFAGDQVVRVAIGDMAMIPGIVWARRLALVALGTGALGAVALSRRRTGKSSRSSTLRVEP
jgi:hypothetical protein